jgi:hypothetical protein
VSHPHRAFGHLVVLAAGTVVVIRGDPADLAPATRTRDRAQGIQKDIHGARATCGRGDEQVIEVAGDGSSQRPEVGAVMGQADLLTALVANQQGLEVMAGIGDP